MIPKLDLIGFVVKDMAASLAFWRHFGWDISADLDSEGHVEHVLDNGLRVAWDTYEVIRSFLPDWHPPADDGGDRIGIAFLCENAAAVDAFYHRMVGLGYASNKEPFTAPWGQRYAQIKDPDGNVLDLFAPIAEG